MAAQCLSLASGAIEGMLTRLASFRQKEVGLGWQTAVLEDQILSLSLMLLPWTL